MASFQQRRALFCLRFAREVCGADVEWDCWIRGGARSGASRSVDDVVVMGRAREAPRVAGSADNESWDVSGIEASDCYDITERCANEITRGSRSISDKAEKASVNGGMDWSGVKLVAVGGGRHTTPLSSGSSTGSELSLIRPPSTDLTDLRRWHTQE
ncbi:uncharacterized protein CC84DRAFT_134077 [Paraphaeosphaeria sporulosa]|uniref:Uncharacterized protein n=1 Tax=Paraphaeosphaeria sporulosa TaxID=1460663 RepID=A0A177CZS7_9PLEO|nr:uncharacterized protein CC84DRAFT_134077 [Paraphaeosphaeria sporulosa]OAG12631.1 hypothetical protein CC84DRAFT_134077 [Paraphaeosphaeria sporulosa]